LIKPLRACNVRRDPFMSVRTAAAWHASPIARTVRYAERISAAIA